MKLLPPNLASLARILGCLREDLAYLVGPERDNGPGCRITEADTATLRALYANCQYALWMAPHLRDRVFARYDLFVESVLLDYPGSGHEWDNRRAQRG